MHTGKLNIEVYWNSDRNMYFTPNGSQKTINLPSSVGYLSREIHTIIIPLWIYYSSMLTFQPIGIETCLINVPSENRFTLLWKHIMTRNMRLKYKNKNAKLLFSSIHNLFFFRSIYYVPGTFVSIKDIAMSKAKSMSYLESLHNN